MDEKLRVFCALLAGREIYAQPVLTDDGEMYAVTLSGDYTVGQLTFILACVREFNS